MKSRRRGSETPDDDFPLRADKGARARKPYASPKLVEYGTIAKLTQGALTVGNDGGVGRMMSMMGMCL